MAPEDRIPPKEYAQCVGRRRVHVESYDDPQHGKTILLHIYLKGKRIATLQFLPAEAEKLLRLASEALAPTSTGGLGRLLDRLRNL